MKRKGDQAPDAKLEREWKCTVEQQQQQQPAAVEAGTAGQGRVQTVWPCVCTPYGGEQTRDEQRQGRGQKHGRPGQEMQRLSIESNRPGDGELRSAANVQQRTQ